MVVLGLRMRYMKLQRVTDGSQSPHEDDTKIFKRRPNGRRSRVMVPFYKFGGQWLMRRPDFEVEVSWADVEKLISAFEKMHHPKAQRIQI
jgi:hypothetical protein